MKFKFTSKQVKGKGRGKLLGFPTINLEIPENFKLISGIYAVKVFIAGQEFIGALHFGPIPTFNETQDTLEVFLIDIKDPQLPDTKNLDIQIETIKYLRSVKNFPNQEGLIKQIEKDVVSTKKAVGLSPWNFKNYFY